MNKLDAILLALCFFGFGLSLVAFGLLQLGKDIREIKEKLSNEAKEKP